MHIDEFGIILNLIGNGFFGIPGLDIHGGSVGVLSSPDILALNSFAWSDTTFVEPSANNNTNT